MIEKTEIFHLINYVPKLKAPTKNTLTKKNERLSSLFCDQPKKEGESEKNKERKTLGTSHR